MLVACHLIACPAMSTVTTVVIRALTSSPSMKLYMHSITGLTRKGRTRRTRAREVRRGKQKTSHISVVSNLHYHIFKRKINKPRRGSNFLRPPAGACVISWDSSVSVLFCDTNTVNNMCKHDNGMAIINCRRKSRINWKFNIPWYCSVPDI